VVAVVSALAPDAHEAFELLSVRRESNAIGIGQLAELVFVIWAWYSVNLVPCNTVVPEVFLHTHVWQIRVLFVNNFLCVVGANLLQSLPAIIDEIVSVWMALPSLAGCDAVINGIVVVATDGAFQIILSIQPIDVFFMTFWIGGAKSNEADIAEEEEEVEERRDVS